MIPTAKETELLKQNYYTTSGTVLKRKAGLKGTQSLLVFLKSYGIVWVSAPSPSSKNQFGGATEPMVWSVFTLYKSPNRLYVKNAEVKEDFISIRTNPLKLSTAVEIYKTLPKVLMSEHENDSVLKLLWSCMLSLEQGIPASAVKFRFYWRLLHYLGIAPSLTHCVSCGAELKEETFETVDGFVCQNCTANGQKVDKDTIAQLRAIALLQHNDFTTYAEELKTAQFNTECEYIISFFSGNR